jgi:hypothetical protein
MFDDEEWVRGSLRKNTYREEAPSPISICCATVTPSPERGEGKIPASVAFANNEAFALSPPLFSTPLDAHQP